jgi:hypothetical protein
MLLHVWCESRSFAESGIRPNLALSSHAARWQAEDESAPLTEIRGFAAFEFRFGACL